MSPPLIKCTYEGQRAALERVQNIDCPKKRRMKIQCFSASENYWPTIPSPSLQSQKNNQRKYSLGHILQQACEDPEVEAWICVVPWVVPKWVTGKAVPHELLLCFVELLFWQRCLRSDGPSSCAWRAEPLLVCFVLTKRPEGCLSPAESCVFQANRKEEAHS